MIVTNVWNPRDLNNDSDFKNILEHGVYANIEFPIFSHVTTKYLGIHEWTRMTQIQIVTKLAHFPNHLKMYYAKKWHIFPSKRWFISTAGGTWDFTPSLESIFLKVPEAKNLSSTWRRFISLIKSLIAIIKTRGSNRNYHS